MSAGDSTAAATVLDLDAGACVEDGKAGVWIHGGQDYIGIVTAKQARRFARTLLEAADEADAAS